MGRKKKRAAADADLKADVNEFLRQVIDKADAASMASAEDRAKREIQAARVAVM